MSESEAQDDVSSIQSALENLQVNTSTDDPQAAVEINPATRNEVDHIQSDTAEDRQQNEPNIEADPVQSNAAAAEQQKQPNVDADHVKSDKPTDEQQNETNLEVNGAKSDESGIDKPTVIEKWNGSDAEEPTGNEEQQRPGGSEQTDEPDIGKGQMNLVMNATSLLEKLDIAESSDGGSNEDDDVSSSMDSTANSGPRQVEDAESAERVASGEEDETTQRPKKRIDLQHQFVRGIVKIQQDRDQYEKQWQSKRQEELAKERDGITPEKRKSSIKQSHNHAFSQSTTTPVKREASKRQFSTMDSKPVQQTEEIIQQHAQQNVHQTHERSSSIYRPPSLRNSEPGSVLSRTPSKDANVPVPPQSLEKAQGKSQTDRSTGRATKETTESMGLRVTFDTEKHKRHIELSKPVPSPPGKGENNFVVTFDTASKERHIDVPGSVRGGNNSFEFKAGKGSERAGQGRKIVRGDNRYRSTRVSLFEVGSTPHKQGEKNGVLEVNTRNFMVAQLPPKDQPFAAEVSHEVKWGDMVESEPERSPNPSPSVNPNSNWKPGPSSNNYGTPDVLEVNRWLHREPVSSPATVPRTKNKQRQKKKGVGSSSPTSQRSDSSVGSEPARDSVRDSTNTVGDSTDTVRENTGRESVWKRLGPKVTADTSRLRTIHYETTANSLENLRRVTEREYLSKQTDVVCGDASEVAVQAAYKVDTKQKRTRLEFYVPRRGSQG